MDTANQKSNPESIKYSKKSRSLTSSVLCHVFEFLPLRGFAVGLLYLSGYWDINPVWVFIAWGLFKYRDQKRLKHNFKQEAAAAVALRNERKLILSNVNPLPSWVYFPDAERCESLNKVVDLVWSSLQPFVTKQLEKLEPMFNDVMSKYKKNPNFKLKNVSLGSITPRVSGVRVHEMESCRRRTAVDIHMFYFSDGECSCSIMDKISFGAGKLEMKGCLRTVISTPDASLLPGVEIYFLHQPKVDFNLTGILNLGDLPGISGLIRKSVDGVIADKLVFPNKFVINYHHNVDFDELEFPDPEGLLKIRVIEAKSLEGAKKLYYSSSNKPSPYVTVAFGSKTFTSKIVKSSIDPEWNFTAEFIVDSFIDDTIKISVYDLIETSELTDESFLDEGSTLTKLQTITQSRNLGTLSLSLKLVKDKLRFDSWIYLEDVIAGMVHLDVSFHKFETNPEQITQNDLPAVLEVYIGNVHNLANSKDNMIAELSVGEATQSSKPVPMNKAVFKEAFSFPVKHPKTDKLSIKLINEKGENALGNAELDINQLLEAKNMEVFNEQTTIVGKDMKSRLSISMRLRSLKS